MVPKKKTRKRKTYFFHENKINKKYVNKYRIFSQSENKVEIKF